MSIKEQVVKQTINAETKLFVVVNNELLFVGDWGHVTNEDRICPEPVESLATV